MQIGLIGLGAMGRHMALRLLERGHHLHVYARRPEAAAPFCAKGATLHGTVAEMATRCAVVVTMVTASADVEEVLVGPAGVLHSAKSGTVVVDMSTISPAVTRRIAATLRASGIDMLDAPVSGGPTAAAAGTLTIMVGGQARVLEAVRPVLECFGTRIVHVGDHGAGHTAKACNQLSLLVNAEGAAEALALGAKLGLDPAVLRDVLLGGLAASRVLELFGERMAQRRFDAGIESRLYDKDLNIVLELARDVDQPVPAASVVRHHLDSIMAAQHGQKDLSILIDHLGHAADAGAAGAAVGEPLSKRGSEPLR